MKRYIQATCNPESNDQSIECDAKCEKDKRDKKIAKAFGNKKQFEENKDKIKFDYYPESAL